MYQNQLAKFGKVAFFILFAALLLALPAAQAQSSRCEILANLIGNTSLFPEDLQWFSDNCVDEEDDDADEPEENTYRPPPVTCPYLPSRVVVSGFAKETQCQMVGEVVIGKTNLVRRGFIDAVDVWHYVNGGLEVCFRNSGWLAFLDATYLQRRVMELEHYHRDGMTCGEIDRIGTVVLLERAAPPAEGDLPLFHSIPLSDCQIKLVETLFLRAQPAGEIIGLVWLNSEVPAFEINGYWYKIEFEGKTGYISRYHRKVLRGGCG